MKPWLQSVRDSSVKGRIVALLLAIAALGIRLALHPLVGDKAPYTTFFLATVASAALAGLWPGILTAVTGALLAGFVMPAGGWLHLIDPSDQFGVARYLLAAGFVSLICEGLISSRERAITAERLLRESEWSLLGQAEELRRSNRDLEQFAFIASHDLREPLRTVNIYTQLVVDRLAPDDAEARQYAAFIRSGVERMDRLVRDLLTYSLVIRGEGEVIAVNTQEAAAEALKNSEALVEQSGAEIEIGSLPIVLAGKAHVTQLFQNLVSNAIKYRKKNVTANIRISATSQNGLATFQVADNGIGIEPQYAEKVFRLFTRLHTDEYEGTGLGLAICRRIVEQYGGNIHVESQPGEGSTFFFTLPQHTPSDRNGDAKRH
jgi:signal transduction histidine kinase